MRQTAKAATEEDSVVNGDSFMEYVIFHSDTHFLRHTCKHHGAFCSKTVINDEPRKCFRQKKEKQRLHTDAHLSN